MAINIDASRHRKCSASYRPDGSVQLAHNTVTNSNSKHTDKIHCHFLRELVRQRDIKVVQVPCDFQHADNLTKALAYDLFLFHLKFLISLK